MSPIFIVLLIAVIGGVGGLLMKARNQSYAASEKGLHQQENAEKYAREVLAPDEKLILTDYPVGTTEVVVLSNRGIYYAKKGSTVFQARYSDIEKCTYTNFTGDKVKSDGDIIHIRIKTASGKCNLYSFTKAKEIAKELSNRVTL